MPVLEGMLISWFQNMFSFKCNLHRYDERLARQRVEEDNARRSGRAKKESLKLTEQLASIDMESSAVPSCLLMHPLVGGCTSGMQLSTIA
jgi:hypothetical protein